MKYKGQWVYFDFSAMFGPLFLSSTGRELVRQPMPDSKNARDRKCWEAFEEWQKTSKWPKKEQP